MEEIKLCPLCNNKVVKIIYGKPNSKLEELEENKQVYLGGCLVDKEMPSYHCFYCDKNYYDKELDNSGEKDERKD